MIYQTSPWEQRAIYAEGELQDIVVQQAGRAGAVVGGRALSAISIVWLALSVVAATALAPVMTAIVCAAGVGLLLVLRPLSRRTRRLANVQVESLGAAAEASARIARQSLEFTVFGVDGQAVEAATRATDDLAVSERAMNSHSTFMPQLFQGLALGALAGGLAFVAGDPATNVADLGAVVLLLTRALSYGQQVQTARLRIHEGQAHLRLVEDYSARHRAPHAAAGERELRRIESTELRGVTYSYGPGGATIGPVDLRVDRGEFVGVLGPSGSGKSTLAFMLMGLRAPTSGDVRINETIASEFAPADVRRLVGFVPQHVELMTGSVRENVAFFRAWVSDEAVVTALQRTALWDEFGDLDLPLGPGRRAVSGGQLQRLGLARAIAGDAELLVLDEPTSSLDRDAEEQVIDALVAVRASGLSAVIISHRDAPIEMCDRVLRMQDGGPPAVSGGSAPGAP